MINILAVVVGSRFGTADGSICAWLQSQNEGTPQTYTYIYIYTHYNLCVLIMIAFLINTL